MDVDVLTTSEDRIASLIAEILDELRVAEDHNTAMTPLRVARMMVRESFAGLTQPMPDVTTFPNVHQIDEVMTVGPISVRSCCAHHLVPIIGKAWIGVLPGASLLGLSKYHRLTAWVMARPIMQEEATSKLADLLVETMQPAGLAVVIRASHLCCTWRGVCDEAQLFTTSVMRGTFRVSPTARAEVLSLFKGQGF